MYRWLLIAVLGGCASEPSKATRHVQSRSFTAQDVLREMASAYSRAQTYRDEGSVVVQIRNTHGRTIGVERSWFNTTFVRPGHLKIDVRQQVSPRPSSATWRYVIWSDAEGANSWWDINGRIRSHKQADEALGAAAGVTHGVTVRVPPMLLGQPVMEYQHAKLVGRESLDGITCYKLRYDDPLTTSQRSTIWIDTEDFLIRRLEQTRVLAAGSVKDIHRYSPTVGMPVPPSASRRNTRF